MVDLSWNRGMIAESRPPVMKPPAPTMIPPQPQASTSRLEPCASTASLFLYAQGSVISCLHHDTLALERRFENHQADIEFISVDNVSERGAGRLVLSYDVGKTAIVWDIFTGTVIARFASFEQLKVATWMRNGNVAFGNEKGDVIIFEPSTSEHISCRTIFDPITALAPGTDCRTYAIGYQNGSIMIATLHPTFTILHTMTTSRGPSSILSLAWHASSSKQKSDMLATLWANGDLRVWSVAKPPAKEPPRVIRVLKRSDGSPPSEPKWMAWSRNGRIVQYLDGETWAWDVRTKHVTYEPVPTIDNPRGFANFGPTATLFTLGPQFTVQQYDVEAPAMVANVQHLPASAIPLPQEQVSLRSLEDPPTIKESANGYNPRRTPFDSSGVEAVRQQRAELSSPVSSRSHANSVSSKASSGKYRMATFSPPSRSGVTGTSFSLTSASGRDTPQASGASYAYASSVSMSSVKSSRAGGSRLRNEVQLSPADRPSDLFPFTRARLNDVPYGHHQPLDESCLTPDDLRQQMLSVVFGFDGDIEGLIRDEMSHHAPSSHHAVLLAQWLGESDTDHMVSMINSGPATTTDWMLLAFSQMSGESQSNKFGQAFVQKLLEIGDIHTAATILLGLGDRNDAIEVYVSQNYYMEAILLTCLAMPTDWQRQSYLVRRWGEHVVSHSQQQLAIRCFMCTGVEPSEPWTSPAAQQAASFAEVIAKRPQIQTPEPPYQKPADPANLMVPNSHARPTASTTRPGLKMPALKLITSFDSQPNHKYSFPGLKSDDRTPTNAPGVTPIAESAVVESALSPGGFGSYKLNNTQSLNLAMNGRTNTPAFNRRRLPSIGETPVDVHPPTFAALALNDKLAMEYGSNSENEEIQGQKQEDNEEGEGLGLLSSARYDPEEYKPSPQTAVQAAKDQFAGIKGLPSPAVGVFEAFKERSDSRASTRERKPEGLQLHLGSSSQNDIQEHPNLLANFRSPASTLNSFSSAKTPSVSSRSIDQYISSLGEASHHSLKYQTPSVNTPGRGRRNTDDATSQASSRRYRSRNESQETRGRHGKRYIQPAKRSPSSPVPMSPEELARINASAAKKPSSRTRSASRVRKPRSRNSSERRQNRSASRNTASRVDTESSQRGRSMDRQASNMRSPSSPLPLPTMTPDDAMRLVASDRERLRVRQRSNSGRPDRTMSTKGDEARRPRTDSRSQFDLDIAAHAEQGAVIILQDETLGDSAYFDDSSQEVRDMVTELAREPPSAVNNHAALIEQRRKQLAAAELEARRLSLARNPSAPNIPFPGELQSARTAPESPPFSMSSFTPHTPGRHRPTASKGSPVGPSSSESIPSRSNLPFGLPSTPRAMRHPKYNGYEETVAVPPVPDSTILLSDARYQGDAEKIGRSMSVPVPETQPSGLVPTDLPMHPRFNPRLPRSRSTSRSRGKGHHRESSGNSYGGSPVTVSIEETIENALVMQQAENPPILPQLQHLNPPPPPPPPVPPLASPRQSSGTIDIAFDNEDFGRLLPRAMTAAPAPSTDTRPGLEQRRRMSFEHRRGRSVNESLSTKIRNLTRVGNNKGSEPWVSAEIHIPYESVQVMDGRL
ncbi:uncharacterized protein BP01DRAFT_361612 [Aspergillus saccharolyticus JOP 1030-1]|uniref:Gem-associated protein 5 TPR domain-containing protein n=1 Tax=Aspergillus saccharolyticus JOP 1030-1 TaxID=1450539 RepID=A0A319ATN7_9EURO|nr:hypothetical protein BP01DRAFT_361612 [Aspergillus saccharolyticus JOP 1030-1]PYH49562.1 hypothetical protein BP01DRAFT_361612 [Aspergillus saccharolyticus JOP 1030-1]